MYIYVALHSICSATGLISVVLASEKLLLQSARIVIQEECILEVLVPRFAWGTNVNDGMVAMGSTLPCDARRFSHEKDQPLPGPWACHSCQHESSTEEFGNETH
jgi:hypothetical protein